MFREECRILMKDTFSVKLTNKRVDCYYDAAFQIFFDEEEKIELIEISRDENIKAIFMGKNVLEVAASDLIKEISQYFVIDESDKEFGYSFIFPEIELNFWRPIIPENETDEDGKYFSTVGIGRKGYFSN